MARKLARVVGERQLASEVIFRALQQDFQIVVGEPVQHQHLRARQQRAVQFEGRVLGRGAHQHDGAVLHHGQETVLLAAVEAMDLIDEQKRALPGLAPHARRLEGFLQVRDAGEHGRQLDKVQLEYARQQPRDGGLAGTRRPPKNDRGRPPRRDHAAHGRVGPEQMILPHDLGERLRAQAVGQGPRRVLLQSGGAEEIAHGPRIAAAAPRHSIEMRAIARRLS